MSEWQEARIKEIELNIRKLNSETEKAKVINSRHGIWAVVAIVALVATVNIICKTQIQVTKLNNDLKIEQLHKVDK